ncbi:MAG: inorganic phosphate transporter [Deltaproteobacteria bacterium]|nr:inorganic phosphate transporter [Deltaproteobacteria bacterium]
MTTLVVIIILLAFLFDFYNGMNDAANSIATVVATKVLPPRLAVLWAATFNFLAVFLFGVAVAKTIGKGVVDPLMVNEITIFSGLIGAIVCSAIATHMGFPISISHALIGGLVGAGIAKAGPACIVWSGLTKTIIFIFAAPLLGFAVATVFSIATTWIVRNKQPSKIDRYFRGLQLCSAAAYSLGHGSNDAQKTMGIIALTLFNAGLLGDTFRVPLWVVFASYSIISLGTFIGGWRVIATLGDKITKLRPIDGFCAETASAITLFFAAAAGIPASTTHTITGGIVAVGATKRMSAVRWVVARRIVGAWILTIPFALSVSFCVQKFIVWAWGL